MDFKAVIFKDDQDENVHMFLLNDNFTPNGLPSLCVSEGPYQNKLTTRNFFVCKVDFIPNRRFDGKFEIMQDFDKFDYMITSDMCFEVENKEDDDFTVHQMIRDGKFWTFVQYLVDKEGLQDKYDTNNVVGDTINKAKENDEK